jgi:hypothetical protein
MLRNLLLALFLFALAFPAVAMPAAPTKASRTLVQDCHGMPVEKQDDDTPHPDGNARLHGCIGCVAPLGPMAAIIDALPLPFIVQQQLERELTGTAQRPSIPPPRS